MINMLPYLICVLAGLLFGYTTGMRHSELMNMIRVLDKQIEDHTPAPPPEPEKPKIVGGDYQPPHEVSTSIDKKRKAGLVETKTPELLDWENKNELDALGKL